MSAVEIPISPESPPSTRLAHLAWLEAESIHIIREVVGEFARPVLLFSGGKDSICMLRLAEKAFHPGPIPFPLLHIDTGHNFPEVIAFRDRRAKQLGAELIVRYVEESLRSGRVAERAGPNQSRNRMQSVTLLDAIAEFRFDALFGGARRDEEKARAKERIFSFRDDHGQWDPRDQRPELWNLYNGRHRPGEHMRVFPISNWTELDIWHYVQQEKLEVPAIYYSHEREVVERDGSLIPLSDLVPPKPGERVLRKRVRFRTVGDVTCTACVESDAASAAEIIEETIALRVAERGTRVDDRSSDAAMEERKREGYF